MPNKDPEEKILLSFADILSIFRQSKYKILCWAIGMGLLGAFIALFSPIRYLAEGTFREKGVKSGSFPSFSVMQMLSGGNVVGGESEATSLMTSRKILKTVIDDMHLQGHLEAISDNESLPKLLKSNLTLVWASFFSRSPKPVLKDIVCPLKFEKLQYSGEIPLAYLIELQNEGKYEVFDLLNSKEFVGKGKLGELFQHDKMSMVLICSDPQREVAPQPFSLTVNSLNNTAKELCTFLKVDSAKFDKSLLTLKCENRDRYKASSIINAVMDSYQSFLRNYHNDMAVSQLDYLGQRRDQLTNNLTELMEKHADYLANDLYNSGFIESDKEMEFLARNQHEYKSKLLEKELEIKRLKNMKPGNLAYYDPYTATEGDSYVINTMLSEMRSLKQQRDSLEIELQKKSVHQGEKIQNSFDQQLNELKEVQDYLNEVRTIAREYDQGKMPDPNSKLLNDSRFLLSGWFERLQNLKQEQGNHSKETAENFKFYLNNLERLFGVHERILQERLTHQQNPSGEYQGISLEVATNLYLDYSRQHIQMEGTIRQNLFFIHQIEDPNFEITSLSSGLTDHVSTAMILKASELVLNLRDQNNQSAREQERIQEQLLLQRTFITMHLKQMVQLMELNKQLFDEKIFALQNVSLELIHQRISLLERNLQDFLSSRLMNLEQERQLIKRQLEIVHSEMALLPQKWVSEKLVIQEVETNRRIVEEIVKLVESKNISHKLEVIQSAPVDLSIPPVHPLNPKFFHLSLIGFLLGGMIGSGLTIFKTFNKGLNASAQNLELMGYKVSGSLLVTSPGETNSNAQQKEINYNTLRRLQTYFEQSTSGNSTLTEEAKLLLLIEGEGVDYSEDLADVFMKRGRRILRINLTSKHQGSDSYPGLSQYFKGEVSAPPIQKSQYGDWISIGGADPFTIDKIHSPDFQQLILELRPKYDWIIGVSQDHPCSAEAENLLTLFPNVAVTLKREKIEELTMYSRFLQHDPKHKLTFVFDVT